MLFFVLDELAGTTAGTATATSQHYWHGTAHCQPENPQTELSHAITRSSPASRSQFAAARPFSFSDHSLLHHWAAGEACCSSRLFFFLQGTVDLIEDIRTHPNTRLATRNLIMTRGVDDDSEQRDSARVQYSTRFDDSSRYMTPL